MKKSYSFRVGFQDTDSTGRVYFPTYVRWFDMAFIEFLRDNGIVFDKQGRIVINGKALNKTFVIGEYGCRIEKPSAYDDTVKTVIDTTFVGGKWLKAEFRLENEAEETLARGYITYVFVDLENGKAAEMPHEVRGVFGAVLDNSRTKT
ncbi:MAG: acyl-CoA thioesterase [Candidatus Caldarchaeum sp.]|nr:acyl-CoA thioesterase [Candidatus Caldarchaeum sp.]